MDVGGRPNWLPDRPSQNWLAWKLPLLYAEENNPQLKLGKSKEGEVKRMNKILGGGVSYRMSLVVALLFACIGIASATDYYVAKDGSDSNPGTEADPWLTIQKAANTMVAGDTVYIKEGTYNERVIPQNSGSPGNYITYTAYPGHTVTIDGTGISTYPRGLFLIENSKSYIKVSRLRIENHTNTGACYGINVRYGCDHIIIENNYVNNIGGCGIHSTGNCSNLIIDNNEVCYTNLDPVWGQEMISLILLDTFEVKNNHVHHSDNIAIDAKAGCSNGKIYKNHVHHTSSGIYTDSQNYDEHDIEIYQNIVHDETSGCYQAATEAGGTLENIRFFNNIGYNSVNGFSIHNYGLTNGSTHLKKNITLINNAFYNNSVKAIQITDYGENFQNFIIRNNILSGGDWHMLNFPHIVEENVTIDHNLFDAISSIYGSDFVIGDPKFVNPAEADFHLQGDSPAIDSGSPVDAPDFDFDGNPRPQGAGYDIGAYEYMQVGSEEKPVSLPQIYRLSQAYPNPSVQEVAIGYQLPANSQQLTAISLRIYDIGGRLVRTLVDGKKAPGYYQVKWYGRDDAGKKVASGIYFYRLEAGEFKATRKLTILR
ncbi:MAG: T9SS type A sorting domain-containing protein [Candidatus Marinimicrobia bacterium]|nr:T9SS type A sorting domain-containing protein [Candidatus Neomarinimicrobiota bacterium]